MTGAAAPTPTPTSTLTARRTRRGVAWSTAPTGAQTNAVRPTWAARARAQAEADGAVGEQVKTVRAGAIGAASPPPWREANAAKRWFRSPYDALTHDLGVGQHVMWNSRASSSLATARTGCGGAKRRMTSRASERTTGLVRSSACACTCVSHATAFASTHARTLPRKRGVICGHTKRRGSHRTVKGRRRPRTCSRNAYVRTREFWS
mmetsp:Transcript_4933/g.11237  ORF Transcript_4933/g.11237 Transcript_4933/m.11237 type:complete len:206 (-) Transcript_4933:99-716(-)